jgi:hypothetical protein
MMGINGLGRGCSGSGPREVCWEGQIHGELGRFTGGVVAEVKRRVATL